MTTPPGGRPVSAEVTDKGQPGQPGKPGQPEKPGGLKAAWKKNPAAIVATAGVGGVVLFALAKKNSGTASDSGGYSDQSTNPGAALPVYDSSASDMYNDLETQLGNLSNQIAGITTGQTGTGSTTTGTTGSTGSSGSTLPGPVHGERTRTGANTIPEIAHLFGISAKELVAYNPGWSLTQTSTFDPHNIAVGTFFRVPATARQKTLHPASK